MSVVEISKHLKDRRINFDCPHCYYTFKVPFQTYISDGSHVACPCCNEDVVIQHNEHAKAFINEIVNSRIVL